MDLKKLHQEKEALATRMKQLLDAAERRGTDLQGAEVEQWDNLEKELDAVNARLYRWTTVNKVQTEINQPINRPIVPAVAGGDTYLIPADGRGGIRGKDLQAMGKTLFRALCPEVFSQQTEEYARLGIVPFLNGVLKGGAGLPPEMRAQSVGIGTAGGYASPQIAFDNIVTQAFIEDPWLREPTVLPLPAEPAAASGLMPILNTSTRTKTSIYQGLDVYVTAENAPLTESELAFKLVSVEAGKLTEYIVCSNEFLADSTMGEPIIRRTMTETLQYVLSGLLIDGSGVAQPLGALNHPDRVIVNRNTVGDVKFVDLVTMMSRLTPGRRARWLISPQAWVEVCQMETSAGYLILDPSQVGERTLLGLPVTVSDHAPVLGTQGDVSLIDMSAMGILLKPTLGVVKSDQVRFNYDQTAFRLTTRLGAASLVSGKVTPRNGGAQTSWCVVLN